MLRRIIQWGALKLFPVWEAAGLHVVPNHFHYPIPATRDLPDSLFDRVSACPGLDWNLAGQQRLLREVIAPRLGERTFAPNPGLSPVDAAILHALVRHQRPRRMVEVGSGHSTIFAGDACVRNAAEGAVCEFVAIDPQPRIDLDRTTPGLTRVRRERVQDVGLDAFADCDLLFIDSSHIAGVGSDVTFEQLEVLPRVKPGCLIHFHDILIPAEYWRDWVQDRRFFWSEQYLLWAFLLFNTEFEIVWASRFMQLTDEASLVNAFPFYKPTDRITSFWIRRKMPGPA